MSTKPHVPESETFQVVLLGSFNPAIFHPQWFNHFELIGADEMGNEDLKMVSPEFTDVNIGPLHLQCLPNRLTLETGNVAFVEKLKDLMEGLLLLLPHTPIKGCGINSTAHFRIESEQYWHKIGHTLAPKELIWNELFRDAGMNSLGIKGTRKGAFSGPINITVAPSIVLIPAKGLFVSANHHYDTPPDLATSGSAKQIYSFFQDTWQRAFEDAKSVATMIFDKIPV